LIAVLPGIGDRASDVIAEGLPRELTRAGVACDVLVVDAHFSYYREETIAERVARDVIDAARSRGYREVWLLGVSMGGLGAILAARRRPDAVAGVVLVAPLLGVPSYARPVIDEIEHAGGLGAWQAGPLPRERHVLRDARSLWSWLDREVEGTPRPRVWLGFGTADRFAWKHEVLAAALPERHVVRAEGGHDWPTWRRVVRELSSRVHWGRDEGFDATACAAAGVACAGR
jgi:pimeloyl-ACP methyl ester carboxylesterase